MKMLPEATPSLGEEIEECNFHSNLLIDDEPLQVLPKLAVAIGLDEAIVVQQLHYWLNPKRKSGKIINGRRWIYNTYAEWRETNFPFWSEIHIKRTFLILEKCGIIVSCQPEGAFSRRKYYRINEGFLLKAKRGELGNGNSERINQIHRTDQIDTFDVSKSDVPSTETTSERTSENTKSAFPKAEIGFSSKPKPEPKAKQLAKIIPPTNHPSEREFNEFLALKDLQYIIDYKPELYDTWRSHKWHVWKQSLKKWVPIINWQKMVIALDAKIETSKNTH